MVEKYPTSIYNLTSCESHTPLDTSVEGAIWSGLIVGMNEFE
jgi:hypothetical protein